MNIVPSLKGLYKPKFQRELEDVIQKNNPIEKTLHVIMVLSNACLYRRRYQLAREFIQRMQRTPYVTLYIVELAYGNQRFEITESTNPRHLQLRTSTPLWHKENMINLGVRNLLPQTWRTFAWIDADIEFENPHWALDTLKVLNGHKDIVQLFETAIHLDAQNKNTKSVLSSGRSYLDNNKPDIWHPGFAWAMTRSMYETIDGLFEYAILGGCDAIMALHLGLNTNFSLPSGISNEFVEVVEAFSQGFKKVRLGYIPGRIRHYYHGSWIERNYIGRWDILRKHHYNPRLHITKNDQGILIPSQDCPREMLRNIMQYFWLRNEDHGTFPDSPRGECPDFLQFWEHVNTGACSSQCNDLQLPVVALVPQCETKHDTENCVVPENDEASVDTPNLENAHAILKEDEPEHDFVMEQMSSTV